MTYTLHCEWADQPGEIGPAFAAYRIKADAVRDAKACAKNSSAVVRNILVMKDEAVVAEFCAASRKEAA